MNNLIGNDENSKEKYCFAKEGEIYVVYLAYVATSTIHLRGTDSSFSINWYNPELGGPLLMGKVRKVKGGSIVDIGTSPKGKNTDWVVVLKKQ